MYVYAKANSYTRWCQACNNKMCLVLYCNENLQIKLPTNFIAMKFDKPNIPKKAAVNLAPPGT